MAERGALETRAVQAAVERGLSRKRDNAAREVKAILDAAVRVTERVAPAAPRVADIVAEAGTSNQAFYRYFAGKDDLMRAVFIRGLARLHSYLVHQVEKTEQPRAAIEAWILGVLNQATDQTAARQSSAIHRQLAGSDWVSDSNLPEIRELLRELITRAGSRHPELDSLMVYELTFATVRRHTQSGTSPSRTECSYLVEFALRGLSVEAPAGPA